MDVDIEEFGGIVISGEEGWSAQQGETSLNSRVDGDNEDETDFVDIDIPMSVVETQTRAGSSRTKRKRKGKDLLIDICVARNEVLKKNNKIMEQMLEREYSSSVEHVVEILNELPRVKKWSPFHRASIDHLLAGAANRQGFVAFSSVEDKISYLEHRTGRKLDD